MNYTEEDLRKLAELIDDAYRPYTTNNVEAHFIIDNFIQNGFEKPEEEKTIPITYGLLNRKIDWEDLHTLIGVGYYALNEGFEIKDTEVFDIKVSDAEKYGLI